MISDHINNPRSIKSHIKTFIEQENLNGLTVLDLPAGDGATSKLLHDAGAKVIPLDLFPEYFQFKEISCERADILDGLRFGDESFDLIICQEGIEHFSDQLKALKEFSRILKIGGRLVITTPSRSCLASKFAYLLFEAETSKRMPGNEIDDIWRQDEAASHQIYHGHLFLMGAQQLRTFAAISQLKLIQHRKNILSKGSLILLPLIYPIILIRSIITYVSVTRKHRSSDPVILECYKNQLRLNLSPTTLTSKHLFMIFQKKAK